MADFRKWFMVIAVVLIAAAAANAQNTIQCVTSAQVPVIRQNGLTEYIGEVDLACTNTFQQAVTAEFALSVNTTITNANDGGANPLTRTEAGVAVQDTNHVILQTVEGILWQPGPVFHNQYGTGTNALRFPNVILPGGTSTTVRIFNVRVAALAPDGSFTGTPILGQVTVNTVVPLGFAVSFGAQGTGTLTVGVVRPALTFQVTDICGTAAAPSITFQQCVDQEEGRQANTFGVKFTELQQTAFKNIDEEDGATLQGVVGPLVSDTDRFDDDGPWVSNGTRLMVNFAVPAALQGNIHIYVSQYQTASSTGAAATLMTTSADGAGTSLNGSTDGRTFLANTCTGHARFNRWVELDDASPIATWEITSDNIGVMDDITFGWTIEYRDADLPSGVAFDPITISGTMGPISTVFTSVPLETAPVVRFWEDWQDSPVPITMDHCVTNLLFPYVTDVAGFNTGIAISNTSMDTAGVDADDNPIPFNTTNQAGVCHLYLFGSASTAKIASAGSAPITPIAATTSAQVVAGQVFADTLTNIFGLTSGTTPITMSGYVIARCEFQYAHGYAYLVNPGGLPQSYLALIIPDRNVLDPQTGTARPIREPYPFSRFANDESGEQLAP
jgi:hypothetical protein